MIHELLSHGAENAITGRELCDLLHIHTRDLTIAIEKERREGKPICASCGNPAGYYLAANKEDMQNYCSSLKHRAAEISKTRRACLKTIGGLPV